MQYEPGIILKSKFTIHMIFYKWHDLFIQNFNVIYTTSLSQNSLVLLIFYIFMIRQPIILSIKSEFLFFCQNQILKLILPSANFCIIQPQIFYVFLRELFFLIFPYLKFDVFKYLCIVYFETLTLLSDITLFYVIFFIITIQPFH